MKQDIVYSDQLAFLSYLINGVWEEIPLRRAPLASYLPTSRLHFGDRSGMVEIWHPRERKFAEFLDMQEYPQLSEPGMNPLVALKAVAHKLARACYHMLQKQVPFELHRAFG